MEILEIIEVERRLLVERVKELLPGYDPDRIKVTVSLTYNKKNEGLPCLWDGDNYKGTSWKTSEDICGQTTIFLDKETSIAEDMEEVKEALDKLF